MICLSPAFVVESGEPIAVAVQVFPSKLNAASSVSVAIATNLPCPQATLSQALDAGSVVSTQFTPPSIE